MKNFKEWLTINESVTFRIKDAERPIENLYYFGIKLNSKVISKFQTDFAQAKNKHDVITVDGDSLDETTGIINFYSEGIPETSITKILAAIKYYIVELGGQLMGEPRKDTSQLFGGTVYRFPIKMTIDQRNLPPELNLSNDNARELLGMLGLNDQGSYKIGKIIFQREHDLTGKIDVRELAMKLDNLTDFSIQMATQAPEQSKGEKGAQMFNGGRSLQQVERYIQTLKTMVQWAMKNHYDTITFS